MRFLDNLRPFTLQDTKFKLLVIKRNVLNSKKISYQLDKLKLFDSNKKIQKYLIRCSYKRKNTHTGSF